MYLPAHFQQNDVAVLHRLMRARPLATLVTLGAGGLNANHVPLHLLDTPAPFGTLRGHVARANPLWSDLRAGVDSLAVFHGPQAYISPNWYPSKKASGRVVPTWNYLAVHASGELRIIDDPAWVRALLTRLTAEHEATQPAPWKLTDAPESFAATMIGNVVGIELTITRLLGKYKASQNQPEQNQAGVADALLRRDSEDAKLMAHWVQTLGSPPV